MFWVVIVLTSERFLSSVSRSADWRRNWCKNHLTSAICWTFLDSFFPISISLIVLYYDQNVFILHSTDSGSDQGSKGLFSGSTPKQTAEIYHRWFIWRPGEIKMILCELWRFFFFFFFNLPNPNPPPHCERRLNKANKGKVRPCWSQLQLLRAFWIQASSGEKLFSSGHF